MKWLRDHNLCQLLLSSWKLSLRDLDMWIFYSLWENHNNNCEKKKSESCFTVRSWLHETSSPNIILVEHHLIWMNVCISLVSSNVCDKYVSKLYAFYNLQCRNREYLRGLMSSQWAWRKTLARLSLCGILCQYDSKEKSRWFHVVNTRQSVSNLNFDLFQGCLWTYVNKS